MIDSNLSDFLSRITKRAARFQLNSPDRQRLLTRIGIKLQSEIVMNVNREKIVDFGILRASIKYQLDADSVTVGSFGVPYAKFHEFGANMPPRAMRAMFASLRRRHSSAVRAKIRDKNVVENGKLRARPFVRPAFQRHAQWIVDEIARYANGD